MSTILSAVAVVLAAGALVASLAIPGPVGPQGLTGTAGSNGSNGSPGPAGANGLNGTARAYALVSHGPAPTIILSKNVTGVEHMSTGRYCVNVTSDIDSAASIALVSPNWAYSAGNQLYAYAFEQACGGAHQFGVVTEQGSPAALSDSVAFEILIP